MEADVIKMFGSAGVIEWVAVDHFYYPQDFTLFDDTKRLIRIGYKGYATHFLCYSFVVQNVNRNVSIFPADNSKVMQGISLNWQAMSIAFQMVDFQEFRKY